MSGKKIPVGQFLERKLNQYENGDNVPGLCATKSKEYGN